MHIILYNTSNIILENMNSNLASKSKNALVTGAAKRVGRAIAIALAADGWNLALHYNNTDITEVATKCKKLGAKTFAIDRKSVV